MTPPRSLLQRLQSQASPAVVVVFCVVLWFGFLVKGCEGVLGRHLFEAPPPSQPSGHELVPGGYPPMQDPLANLSARFLNYAQNTYPSAAPAPLPTPSAQLAAFRQRFPAEVGAAESAWEAIGASDRESLHALSAVYATRLGRLDPEFGFRLGLHPHPPGLTERDARYTADVLVLTANVDAALTESTAGRELDGHEQTDLELFQIELTERANWRALDRSRRELLSVERALDALPELLRADCCSHAERLACAQSKLKALPARLRGLCERLNAPQQALLKSTADRFEEVASYLRTYASRWGTSEPEFVDTCFAAVQALEAAQAELQARFTQANALIGIGRPAYERFLRRAGGPDASVKALLDDASRAFAEAVLQGGSWRSSDLEFNWSSKGPPFNRFRAGSPNLWAFREQVCVLRSRALRPMDAFEWDVYARKLPNMRYEASWVHFGTYEPADTTRLAASFDAVFEVLLHCQIESPERLQDLLNVFSSFGIGQPSTVHDLGDRAKDPGEGSAFFRGWRAVHDLRQRVKGRPGAAFDPESFYAQVLNLGNVPPHLLAGEIGE